MKLAEAKKIAEAVKSELAHYCARIEIAGSIRRLCPEVRDLEIVCIPKNRELPYVGFRRRNKRAFVKPLNFEKGETIESKHRATKFQLAGHFR